MSNIRFYIDFAQNTENIYVYKYYTIVKIDKYGNKELEEKIIDTTNKIKYNKLKRCSWMQKKRYGYLW